MTITSAPQFALSRTRKSLDTAFKTGNWNAIKDTDKELTSNLNAAFNDENRDIKSLIDELEKIVHLYGEMVSNLPNQSNAILTSHND